MFEVTFSHCFLYRRTYGEHGKVGGKSTLSLEKKISSSPLRVGEASNLYLLHVILEPKKTQLSKGMNLHLWASQL